MSYFKTSPRWKINTNVFKTEYNPVKCIWRWNLKQQFLVHLCVSIILYGAFKSHIKIFLRCARGCKREGEREKDPLLEAFSPQCFADCVPCETVSHSYSVWGKSLHDAELPRMHCWLSHLELANWAAKFYVDRTFICWKWVKFVCQVIELLLKSNSSIWLQVLQFDSAHWVKFFF